MSNQRRLALFLLALCLSPCALASTQTPTSPTVQPRIAKEPPRHNAHRHDKLSQGWKAWRDGRINAALRQWERFAQELRPDAILLFAGIYRDRNNAFQTLLDIGESHRGLLLRHPFHEQTAYYVLLAPMSGHLEAMRAYLRQALHIANPRGRSAAFFQHRGVSQPRPRIATSTADTTRARSPDEASKSVSRAHPAVLPVRQPRGPEPDTAMLVARSRQALERGAHAEALRLLGKALHQQPGMREARLLYARLWIATGDPNQATLALAPLLNDQEADWRPWFWGGTASLLSGRWEKASRLLDEALARDGKHASIWIQRAVAAQQRGRPALALQMLKMAETMRPGLPATWLNMAIAQESLGQKQEAMRAWRTFIQLEAGQACPTDNRGHAPELAKPRGHWSRHQEKCARAGARTRQALRKTVLRHLAELAASTAPGFSPSGKRTSSSRILNASGQSSGRFNMAR